MKFLDSVMQYLRMGIPTIPMNPRDKRPLVPWKEFQKRLPTEEEAAAWWGSSPEAMIGLVTGQISNLCVVDCDSPQAQKKIEAMLPETFDCPVAQTPRGGRHYYFACTENRIPTKTAIFEHCDIRGEGGCIVCPPSKNAQDKQYRWLDGLELTSNRLQPIPEPLLTMLKSAHSINNNNVRTRDCLDSVKLFEPGRRDNDLFTLANSLVKSGMPEREIFKYLEFIVHSWGEHDETWINAKLESAFKRNERRERSLAGEVREWVLSSDGQFLSREVQDCLGVSSRFDKKNISFALSQLLKEGLIERCGNKNGCFRRIDQSAETIDFLNADAACLEIKLPFRIEQYVKLMPKNIIVVAGEPNSGKTAFLLNLIFLNMGKHDIFYFSSEMGALEMCDRLSKFDIPLDRWKFKAIERGGDFADVVKPDAINIIDYLEMSNEFYKVSGYIKNIFDKLRGGVAIIALQKNRGTDFGLGGMRSLEKPRLYLAMEPGKLKIVKAKNWANPEVNPNGLVCDFKLADGCKFIPMSGWKKG